MIKTFPAYDIATNLILKKPTIPYGNPEIYPKTETENFSWDSIRANISSTEYFYSRSKISEIDTSTLLDELTEIQGLKSHYLIREEHEVINFIKSKNNFTILLFELHDQITKRFGQLKPIIEIVHDWELPSFITLSITIPTEEDFTIAFNKLKSLIKEWLFFQSQDFRSTITISIF